MKLWFGEGASWSGPTPQEASCDAVTLDHEGFFLIGDATTTAFLVTDGNAPVRRIVAESPPGMPTWRVATLRMKAANGGVLPGTVSLSCERSGS